MAQALALLGKPLDLRLVLHLVLIPDWLLVTPFGLPPVHTEKLLHLQRLREHLEIQSRFTVTHYLLERGQLVAQKV
jgi:hypothetical protein